MAKKKKLKEEFDEVDLFMSGRAYQVKLGKIGKDGEVPIGASIGTTVRSDPANTKRVTQRSRDGAQPAKCT